MIRNLIVAAFVIGGFGFILFQIFQFFFSVGGSRTRIEKDKKELKLLSGALVDELVPINEDELALLSSKLESQRVTKGMYYTEKGVLNSIYEEPMLTYGYRNYGSGKSVLVANTHESQFEFVERGDGVEMKVNGYLHGVITGAGTLVGVDGERIANIVDDPRSDYQAITIRERKVAELLNPESQDITNNSRAFLELKPLDEVEQNILLGVMIYNSLIKA